MIQCYPSLPILENIHVCAYVARIMHTARAIIVQDGMITHACQERDPDE